MKNVIFIAPPAAGKGTQSQKLHEKYKYIHISTGDILRKAIKDKTQLGLQVKEIMSQGHFVSDDIMIALIKDTLTDINKPFILDGFPRTISQAKALTQIFNDLNIKDYCVIYLDVKEDIAMKRSLGRLVCPECNKTYNKYFSNLKPKVPNICDKCNSELISRSDDNEKSFKKRFENYLNEISSIIEYYKSLNILKEINAEKSDEEIFCDIIKELNEG